MTTFKVWIDIEMYDEETGEGQMVDAPNGAIAGFDTYEQAWFFAKDLAEKAEKL